MGEYYLYIKHTKTFLSKISLFDNRNSASISSIGELADKIIESYGKLQDFQYFQNEQRDKEIKSIIGETRRIVYCKTQDAIAQMLCRNGNNVCSYHELFK